jgi:hypothetical protein
MKPLRMSRSFKFLIGIRRGIEADVQTRVVPLRGMPEGEQIRLAADDLSEEKRIVFSRPYNLDIQVVLFKELEGYVRA